VINRCGVIVGPGQFGTSGQGVFALWVARHEFGRPLRYTGFGGKGLQVRDLLHPQDLCELLDRQLAAWPRVHGQTFNIGGGRAGSVSLQEYTALCRQVTGREAPIAEDPQTTAVDIPWYITDHCKATDMLAWSPRHGPLQIVSDIAAWVRVNSSVLAGVIA
jgi:CDP-paratose 2-epimerase